MDRNETNRAKQVSIEKQYQKGIKLIDVDTTIAEYMVDKIIPDVMENESVVKVPLLYGNAERWNNARKEGYLRDQRGKIQIPLVMFKRNSIEKDTTLPNLKQATPFTTYRKYSPKNKYDRFSIITNSERPLEQHSIAVPSYVTVTYEVMIWTSFTEHMNKITEAFQYASDTYWGSESGYKFRAVIDSFDTAQEVGQGSERIIRTTFTLVVHAYLLPEEFGDKPLVKKSLTPKKVVWGVETDLTGNLFSSTSLYSEYQDVINFVAMRGNQTAEFYSIDKVKLKNVRLPQLPDELRGTFDVKNWFRVYINGQFIDPDYYTYTFDGITNEITFTFDLNQVFSGGVYVIENTDEIVITGKFLEL